MTETMRIGVDIGSITLQKVPEEAGAVDLGGLHQVLRNVDVEAPGEDGGEWQPVDRVDEDEAREGT